MDSNSQKKERRKRSSFSDRIILEPSTIENLKSYALQIEKHFAGAINLSSKELVNFLLQIRSSELSAKELTIVQERFFDDIRAAEWVLKRLRKSKEDGRAESLVQIVDHLKISGTTMSRKVKKVGSGRVKNNASNMQQIDQNSPEKLEQKGEI